jgi:hypothetical protein
MYLIIVPYFDIYFIDVTSLPKGDHDRRKHRRSDEFCVHI